MSRVQFADGQLLKILAYTFFAFSDEKSICSLKEVQ